MEIITDSINSMVGRRHGIPRLQEIPQQVVDVTEIQNSVSHSSFPQTNLNRMEEANILAVDMSDTNTLIDSSAITPPPGYEEAILPPSYSIACGLIADSSASGGGGLGREAPLHCTQESVPSSTQPVNSSDVTWTTDQNHENQRTLLHLPREINIISNRLYESISYLRETTSRWADGQFHQNSEEPFAEDLQATSQVQATNNNLATLPIGDQPPLTAQLPAEQLTTGSDNNQSNVPQSTYSIEEEGSNCNNVDLTGEAFISKMYKNVNGSFHLLRNLSVAKAPFEWWQSRSKYILEHADAENEAHLNEDDVQHNQRLRPCSGRTLYGIDRCDIYDGNNLMRKQQQESYCGKKFAAYFCRCFCALVLCGSLIIFPFTPVWVFMLLFICLSMAIYYSCGYCWTYICSDGTNHEQLLNSFIYDS